MSHFRAVGFSLVHHSQCEPPKKSKYYKKHRGKTSQQQPPLHPWAKKNPGLLFPWQCFPPLLSASQFYGLWVMDVYHISIYIFIYRYIYIYSFSSRFTGQGIFHSSQAPVRWIFCRSHEEGEPLNHQEALTMQTLQCKIAFKKHLLFMA